MDWDLVRTDYALGCILDDTENPDIIKERKHRSRKHLILEELDASSSTFSPLYPPLTLAPTEKKPEPTSPPPPPPPLESPHFILISLPKQQNRDLKKSTKDGDARGIVEERTGAGVPEMDLRRRQGRGGEDDMQFDPLHFARWSATVSAGYLHRPGPQPKRRLPTAFHQDPHARQWLLQPLRYGNLLSVPLARLVNSIGLIRVGNLGNFKRVSVVNWIGIGCRK